MDSRLQEAISRLLWVSTPEAACRLMGSQHNARIQDNHGVDPAALYFEEQNHNDLGAFANTMLDQWSDGVGSQINLLTFSPLTFMVADVLRKQTKWQKVALSTEH